MKPGIDYQFHHVGVPTAVVRPGERFSPTARMFTADHAGAFPLQWHRFLADSPVHPLLQSVPHVAFRVPALEQAIEGERVILGPYEPIDGYRVAVIDDAGVPVELVQTELSREELWARARQGRGSLYEKPQQAAPNGSTMPDQAP